MVRHNHRSDGSGTETARRMGTKMGRHHDHGHHEHDHGFGRGRRGWGRGEGPRARRGDVKYFILEVLEKGPRHGL